MLQVIGARCVAHDFYTIMSWPLERTCWRQFAAQRGDCKKSQTALLNGIIIIIIIIIIFFFFYVHLGFTNLGEVFACVTVFQSNH